MSDLATKRLYHSDRLYDFQVEGVAKSYLKLIDSDPVNPLLVWDTGIGKSHLAMMIAAMGFEDDAWDLVLLVCEQNKTDPGEWPGDLDAFTEFDWCLYYGAIKKREKLRGESHQVMLSTYETFRADIAKKMKVLNERKRMVERIVPGPLTEMILERKLRVLIVYDEMTKLGNRKSGLYKHHECMITTLKKAGLLVGIVGLTATPIERGVENYFNLGRLLYPAAMPTVVQFEQNYVAAKDFFGNYSRFKNLNEDDHTDPSVPTFSELMRPVLLRKRKTDPDVIDQFPQTNEEPPIYIRLGDRHQEFYETVKDVYSDCDEMMERQLFTVMRQIAGHPCSLLHSKGQIAQVIAGEVGEAGLRKLGSAKCDRLVQRLLPIVKGQGAQAVVFSFFTSVIPYIQEALEEAKITVAPYHGDMAHKAREESKAAWKKGRYEVLLSSDAGARGINLPEAMYVFEYEMALTRANQIQRLNRIHRIDSKHACVTFQSLIAYDTVEEGVAAGVMRRNDWMDKLLDDEDTGEHFITAKQRKELLKLGRRAAA